MNLQHRKLMPQLFLSGILDITFAQVQDFLDVCRHSPKSATSTLSLTIGTFAKGITAQSRHVSSIVPLRLLFGHADMSKPPLGFPPLTVVNALILELGTALDRGA
jgi:hypothetical protein